MLRNFRNYFVRNRYSLSVFVLLNVACAVCIVWSSPVWPTATRGADLG